MGLDIGSVRGKWTRAESKPLAKDEDGDPTSFTFNYASLVGMLLYLAEHTHPDIAYAINCAAQYCSCWATVREIQ